MLLWGNLAIKLSTPNEFFRTHRGKIVLMAFIGIQILIITSIFSIQLFIIFDSEVNFYRVLASIAIEAIASGIILAALYQLLSPILLTTDILNWYLQNGKIDRLPADSNSEIGNLIADTDKTLERLNKAIQHLTNYDKLTGLPNRSLFKELVQQAIDRIEAEQFAIVVLDLDNLKDINSILGREIGNLLLINVAQRLTTYLEPNDILARLGSSDFVVLRSNISNHDSLIDLSRHLLGSFCESFLIGDRQISCAAKIGITIYPLDGATAEQLLQNADTAIYQSKQQNLNTYQFYRPAMTGKLRRTLAIKENLRYALIKNELYIHYQPRIEIATGKLVGVEALLRWNSPELGCVSPAEFIPIAEATNMIMTIGEWVLRNACLQSKRWQELGIASLKVSVNLSPCQFKQVDLIETIDRILKDTDLDSSYLELEITESLLVEDFETAIALLSQLKQRGISIALDDFGTGYSSLRYLQRLPIDTLKIDRSFVSNIASHPDDAAISKAIVALAQSLELNITAEGVETAEQLNYLQRQGCHEVQGYYFSKPLAPEMLEIFLANYSLKATSCG